MVAWPHSRRAAEQGNLLCDTHFYKEKERTACEIKN